MHDTQITSLTGRIADVFAHRFTVEIAGGMKILADIGSKGLDVFTPRVGLVVEAEGEKKPSELKVTRIAEAGGPSLAIAHKPKHDDVKHPASKTHDDADPATAAVAATSAGFTTLGDPRRKPKHFEILARGPSGLVELHVTLDGHIRKQKPVDAADEKWSREVAAAA